MAEIRKATVIGPPGYGSPDPQTSAGRLVPLKQHPFTNLKRGGHRISEDYGKDLSPKENDEDDLKAVKKKSENKRSHGGDQEKKGQEEK